MRHMRSVSVGRWIAHPVRANDPYYGFYFRSLQILAILWIVAVSLILGRIWSNALWLIGIPAVLLGAILSIQDGNRQLLFAIACASVIPLTAAPLLALVPPSLMPALLAITCTLLLSTAYKVAFGRRASYVVGLVLLPATLLVWGACAVRYGGALFLLEGLPAPPNHTLAAIVIGLPLLAHLIFRVVDRHQRLNIGQPRWGLDRFFGCVLWTIPGAVYALYRGIVALAGSFPKARVMRMALPMPGAADIVADRLARVLGCAAQPALLIKTLAGDCIVIFVTCISEGKPRSAYVTIPDSPRPFPIASVTGNDGRLVREVASTLEQECSFLLSSSYTREGMRLDLERFGAYVGARQGGNVVALRSARAHLDGLQSQIDDLPSADAKVHKARLRELDSWLAAELVWHNAAQMNNHRRALWKAAAGLIRIRPGFDEDVAELRGNLTFLADLRDASRHPDLLASRADLLIARASRLRPVRVSAGLVEPQAAPLKAGADPTLANLAYGPRGSPEEIAYI